MRFTSYVHGEQIVHEIVQKKNIWAEKKHEELIKHDQKRSKERYTEINVEEDVIYFG